MRFCFLSPGHTTVDVLNGDTRKSGGAEAQVAHLAAAFVSLGHQVDVIYRGGSAGSAPSVIAGVKCIDAFPSWRYPRSLLTFWRELKESDADLIYTRLPHDFLWLAGLFAKRSTRTTFVYALANDKQCNPWRPFATRNRCLHSALFALGLRMADVVAVQHEAQAQMVKPYIKGQCVLIPNLVRSVQSEPRRYEETTIDAIWIAHIRPQKQLSILLDIAEQLPTQRFVVVGGFGPEPNRSELECRMQGLRNLRFEGPHQLEDVIQLLMSSRVLVNTSSWEGFPNTMLEAWSVGVPVVSLQTDPGGVISREGLGLVSGTRSQMLRDIMKLVEERPLNCEMGKRGHEYVRRAHGIGAVCRAFEQIVPGFQAQHDAAREGIA